MAENKFGGNWIEDKLARLAKYMSASPLDIRFVLHRREPGLGGRVLSGDHRSGDEDVLPTARLALRPQNAAPKRCDTVDVAHAFALDSEGISYGDLQVRVR